MSLWDKLTAHKAAEEKAKTTAAATAAETYARLLWQGDQAEPADVLAAAKAAGIDDKTLRRNIDAVESLRSQQAVMSEAAAVMATVRDAREAAEAATAKLRAWQAANYQPAATALAEAERTGRALYSRMKHYADEAHAAGPIAAAVLNLNEIDRVLAELDVVRVGS